MQKSCPKRGSLKQILIFDSGEFWVLQTRVYD